MKELICSSIIAMLFVNMCVSYISKPDMLLFWGLTTIIFILWKIAILDVGNTRIKKSNNEEK